MSEIDKEFGRVDPALVNHAPAGHGPSGFDPARGCQCRLCLYDVEFAAHLAFVPDEHRAFFEELKERWEAVDFDAQWFRGCVGGEEYTVEFCERYDAEAAKVRRRRDSGRLPEGEKPEALSAEQARAAAQPHRPTSTSLNQGADDGR